MHFIMLHIPGTETTVTYVTCTHQVKRGALFDSSQPLFVAGALGAVSRPEQPEQTQRFHHAAFT